MQTADTLKVHRKIEEIPAAEIAMRGRNAPGAFCGSLNRNAEALRHQKASAK